MKTTLFALAAATSVAMLTLSCSGKSSNQQQDVMSRQNVEENVREFVYPLPTAFEVTEMLNRIDAPYILTLCNEQSNYEKYLTEPKKALNMGIYSADLCYASTYNQQQSVKEYIDIIRKLIDGLDITSAVDPDLPNKIESNENNKEGLTQIISESFYDVYDYLNRNDRGPVSLLIVTGSWVEGLYITTHISDNTFENKEMVKIIMSQKDPLVKLMELLGKYQGNESIDNAKALLTPLFEAYQAMEEGSITEAQIQQIKTDVYGIRTEMVKF
ncbi:MAG: hypothetical protein J6Y82_02040 [Bacteroidales bacterium]|nr:hypothetical protein [Bacteroidales bacterium]